MEVHAENVRTKGEEYQKASRGGFLVRERVSAKQCEFSERRLQRKRWNLRLAMRMMFIDLNENLFTVREAINQHCKCIRHGCFMCKNSRRWVATIWGVELMCV